MRANLLRMLDDLGLPRCLGIESSAELFDRRADLRHGTSAIRYAAFVSERNSSSLPLPKPVRSKATNGTSLEP
jgi:hypothetical protein